MIYNPGEVKFARIIFTAKFLKMQIITSSFRHLCQTSVGAIILSYFWLKKHKLVRGESNKGLLKIIVSN